MKTTIALIAAALLAAATVGTANAAAPIKYKPAPCKVWTCISPIEHPTRPPVTFSPKPYAR